MNHTGSAAMLGCVVSTEAHIVIGAARQVGQWIDLIQMSKLRFDRWFAS